MGIEGKGINRRYWVETGDDTKNNCINHIVFAKDGTEAGPIYNISGKVMLTAHISAISKHKPFCLEDSLQSYLRENFSKYIDVEKADFKIKLEKEAVLNSNNDKEPPKQNEHIKVYSEKLKSLEFKQCNYDELGYLKVHFNAKKAQQLPYVFAEHKDTYELIVEMPHFTQGDIENLRFTRPKDKEGFYFVIEGEKKMTCPETLLIGPPTMQFGQVICQTEKILFAKSEFEAGPTRELKDGVLRITWKKKRLTGDDF